MQSRILVCQALHVFLQARAVGSCWRGSCSNTTGDIGARGIDGPSKLPLIALQTQLQCIHLPLQSTILFQKHLRSIVERQLDAALTQVRGEVIHLQQHVGRHACVLEALLPDGGRLVLHGAADTSVFVL